MLATAALIIVATLLQETQGLEMQQAQQQQFQPVGQQVPMLQQQIPLQQAPQVQQLQYQGRQLMPPQPQQLSPDLQVQQISKTPAMQISQSPQFFQQNPGVPASGFPAPQLVSQTQNGMLTPNVQYVSGTPAFPMAPAGEVPQMVDLSNIDVKEVASLVDNGELPSQSILTAIFSAPTRLGAKLPQEIRDLKTHLLNRIVKHKGLLLKALETKQDEIVKEIVDALSGEGEAEEKETPEEKEEKQEKQVKDQRDDDDDGLYDKIPKLPLTVGFDPFLQKPKPSFFGRTRSWFSSWFGGSNQNDTNVGNFLDNRRASHNSFEREGSGWGRSTVYYPPLKYSSHLIPVSSGALDLKSYEFRPYKNGHPRITRRRFVTRILVRKNDTPVIKTRRKISSKKKN